MTSYGSTNGWNQRQNSTNYEGESLSGLRQDDASPIRRQQRQQQHISSASMPSSVYHNETSRLNRQSISPPFLDGSNSNSFGNSSPQQQQQQRRQQQRRRSDPTHNHYQVQFDPNHYHHHHHEYHRSWSSHRSGGGGDDDQSVLNVDHHWLPDAYEHEFLPGIQRSQRLRPRSLKRRCFLFLTEFESSRGSAIFFVLLMVSIFVMNVVMIMQTMHQWQYTPDDCITCGGPTIYTFEDDESMMEASQVPGVPCVCPPTPLEWTDTVLRWLIYFFTVEWILRVVLFEPPAENMDGTNTSNHRRRFWRLWLAHLTDAATVLDALAIFPFYLESIENTNGLMSLRLLRLFRVFQLLRLGQYNSTFWSLTNVLSQSIMYLRLLLLVLVFGAALFGSLIYWLEKGVWQYHEASGQYRFMRIGVDGKTEEPSPFTSIPAAFWWFMVTASTVGYGDVYPTTTPGKFVAAGAMLTGVLVVAFPVSVFSDLWAKEVEKRMLLQQQQQQHQQHHSNNNFDRDDSDPVMAIGGFSERGEQQQQQQQQQQQKQYYNYHHEESNGEGAKRATNADNFWSSFSRLSSMQQEAEEQDNKKERAEEQQPDNKRGKFSASTTALTPTTTTMNQHDMNEILYRLDTIRENENRIRNLLRKYRT